MITEIIRTLQSPGTGAPSTLLTGLVLGDQELLHQLVMEQLQLGDSATCLRRCRLEPEQEAGLKLIVEQSNHMLHIANDMVVAGNVPFPTEVHPDSHFFSVHHFELNVVQCHHVAQDSTLD